MGEPRAAREMMEEHNNNYFLLVLCPNLSTYSCKNTAVEYRSGSRGVDKRGVGGPTLHP